MQLFKSQLQAADSFGRDPANDDLIGPALRVNVDATATHDLHALFEFEVQLCRIAGPNDAVDLSVWVFEVQINVTLKLGRVSPEISPSIQTEGNRLLSDALMLRVS